MYFEYYYDYSPKNLVLSFKHFDLQFDVVFKEEDAAKFSAE